jgi:chain length determinant protein tyrosine kinase EpsG
MERNSVKPVKGFAQRAAATHSPADTRLGELLQHDGTLTEQDVRDIMAAQRLEGERFGEVAARLGLVKERDLQHALARHAEFPLAVPGESTLSPELITAYQPATPRAEELRTLRSELGLRWFGRGNRALAIVEPRPGDGGGVLAANIAVAFAQLGERTLLIDANLRTPSQQELFGLKSNVGLADFIKGRETLDGAAVKVAGFSCLSVMFAGALPPNPQELLAHVSFAYLMEAATTKFGVVILDTPPMLQCADAQLIAARAGGAVLATQRHTTRLADVVRIKSLLEAAGVTLLGAVVDG